LKKALILLILIISFSSCEKDKKVPTIKVEEKIPEVRFGYEIDNYTVIQDTIRKGESFSAILDRHHVGFPKISKIADSIKDIFDVRKVRTGKPYTILASKDTLEKAQVFIYKHNIVNATIVDFKDSTIIAKRHQKPIKTVVKIAEGIINTNLSVAMDSLNLSTKLTWEIADIYAWTLDFYKLQKGDSFKFVYEEKFIEGDVFAGYGEVKSAVFKHGGKDLYAFKFVADSVKGIPEYYDEKGNMLRSQFLKSPIKFRYRISSRYNLRRRIAYYGNRIRPHRGTDFAAVVGTPIIATASGTVVESTRRGGNGKFVKVKHNGTYSTQYLHMKNQKVKKGQFVKQGDVIGWVGMTGNTGGPHVCYRFWKNGKEVDPFKEKLPSAEPLKDSVKPKYLEFITPLKYQLENKVLPVKEPEVIESIVQN
jgi:murein DD-endopeptidase MepM/ murein hydrolase activator NlpD